MITRGKVISSLIYKFIERTGSQGVTFIVSIILARILEPANYGVIAILTTFIAIANVFSQSGLNTALIQKSTVDETDFSSVFYVSEFIAVVSYIVLFAAAPFIALFYNMPELTITLRIMALILIPNTFNSIQIAKISREMNFKSLTVVSISAAIFSGIVAICATYMGAGVWALVVQQLTASVTTCIIMLVTVKWRPKLLFSFPKVKELYSFGWKLLASNLIDTLYNNLQSLVIGKKYSASMLAYYNRGNHYAVFFINNINGTLGSVMFPSIAAMQNDITRVKAIVRRTIKMSSFLIFPAMAGLAATAKPIVVLLLTEKWLPCVPFLQLSCILYAFWPIHTANLQAISALGRSDILLKLEIIKKIYGVTILLIAVFCFESVMAIMVGFLIVSVSSLLINTYPNKKLLDYSIKEQFFDILKSLVTSCLMYGIVYTISYINCQYFVMLILQIITGIAVYFILSYVLKSESLFYVIKILKLEKLSLHKKRLNK